MGKIALRTELSLQPGPYNWSQVYYALQPHKWEIRMIYYLAFLFAIILNKLRLHIAFPGHR